MLAAINILIPRKKSMKKEISQEELVNYLNELLNPKAFEEKVYNGIQIQTKKSISTIATAVSISKEVIQKTIEMQAQALIVHHGIFRKGDTHPLVGRIYDYVEQLIKHDIALLCYHLPLDAHQIIGNNWKAAYDLGLQDCVSCVAYNGMNIGVIGEVNYVPFEDFKKKVERYYDRSAQWVKVQDTVNKVAIVSGAADGYIKDVAHLGADCFITGRVDEPVWDNAHEYGVSFLGMGHYGTEIVGIKALAGNLEEYFKIPAIFIKTDNPF